MRWISVLCAIVLLSGCSSLSLSDLASSGGAAGGAFVGASVAGPAGAVVGAASGGLAGGAIVPDSVSTAEACADNPEACTTIAVSNTIQDFIHWIIGGGVVLLIVAWLIPGPTRLFGKRID